MTPPDRQGDRESDRQRDDQPQGPAQDAIVRERVERLRTLDDAILQEVAPAVRFDPQALDRRRP